MATKADSRPVIPNKYAIEDFQGSNTKILTEYSPSVLQLNVLKNTHINIAAKHNGELILYNQIVKAETNLEFIFDTEIKFDLLNARHIQANLNGISLETYFKKNDFSLRGSYIVNSAQLYIGYFEDSSE